MQENEGIIFGCVCTCVWIDQKTMMQSEGKRGDVTHPLLDFAEKGSFFFFNKYFLARLTLQFD